MADYTAYFRSNYFAVKDAGGFQFFCAEFNCAMMTKIEGEQTLYGFYGNDHGIPVTRYNEEKQSWEEADLLSALADHLTDDYVAIVMEVGFEKMRYLIGEAHAVNAAGEIASLDLDEIYERAAALGSKRTHCSY